MFIQCNGQIIYYEKRGEGTPILLLHGNGESHEILNVAAAELAKNHTVYLPDLRGHGQSSPVETFHYADMAEDIAEFIESVGLIKPALFGFSDGGIIGLILAAKYPNHLCALAVAGANITPGGLKLRYRIRYIFKNLFSKKALITLMLKEPHMSASDLEKIGIPVLVLAGAKDMISTHHTKKITALLPDATLQILPNETHSSYVVHSKKVAPVLAQFFFHE